MPFSFNHFFVDDSQCAMKVGTDSVLLGAWTDFSGCSMILDIGTGCGLLALIAAQQSTNLIAAQSNALITAIDIDEAACRQAEENFRKSTWNSQLQCIHSSLEEFTINRDADAPSYDLIITNPPFFINSLKSPHTGRNTARHTDGLPLDSLLACSALLLSATGKLSIVFTYADSNILINTAQKYALNPSRQLIIIPKQGKKPNRILLEFTKGPVKSVETTELAIRDGEGKYTDEYVKITEDFYL